jgi:hypothetical protein
LAPTHPTLHSEQQHPKSNHQQPTAEQPSAEKPTAEHPSAKEERIVKKTMSAAVLVSLVAVFGIGSSAFAAASIDIRPGSDKNVVNPDSKGVIQVALLGAEDFDINGVSVSALNLSTQASSTSSQPKGNGRIVDINDDGYMDLVLNFPIQGTGVRHGDTQLCLAGTGFQTCDAIQTVPE